MDYAVEHCVDKDGNKRCTTPFLVHKSTCYEIKWSTDGALSHTTAEFRDAGSNEIVYYRDTNGQWTPKKGEVSCLTMARDIVTLSRCLSLMLTHQLVYLDFKPKIGHGNKTVDYEVKTCE